MHIVFVLTFICSAFTSSYSDSYNAVLSNPYYKKLKSDADKAYKTYKDKFKAHRYTYGQILNCKKELQIHEWKLHTFESLGMKYEAFFTRGKIKEIRSNLDDALRDMGTSEIGLLIAKIRHSEAATALYNYKDAYMFMEDDWKKFCYLSYGYNANSFHSIRCEDNADKFKLKEKELTAYYRHNSCRYIACGIFSFICNTYIIEDLDRGYKKEVAAPETYEDMGDRK